MTRFEIRGLDRDKLEVAYGVASQRLLPWELLNAPFEGAFCKLGPGEASDAHSHHEYELFIAMKGRAVLDEDGDERDFVAGDLAHHMPGTHHYVRNVGEGDFEWYAIWWDTDMSDRFRARHAQNPPVSESDSVQS
ncbi:cupin domain-containing protein [Nocardia sp. NPDC051570]|uniref:cupin domain-containing protein n=1 Tax=Nocardia sp. NPDC051570 TaxID=3364324 RepID=UPI0037ACB5AA